MQRESPELEITPLHPVNPLNPRHRVELNEKEKKCEAVRRAVRILSLPQVEMSPVEQKRKDQGRYKRFCDSRVLGLQGNGLDPGKCRRRC